MLTWNRWGPGRSGKNAFEFMYNEPSQTFVSLVPALPPMLLYKLATPPMPGAPELAGTAIPERLARVSAKMECEVDPARS